MESNSCDYDNGASKQSETSLTVFDKHKRPMQKQKQGQKLSMDPQSIAARNRRHKIRRRFKILQSMIPGGKRLDTVSMLDEAIQYVKFLQLMHIWLQARIMQENLCTTNSTYNASFLYPQDPCNSTAFNVHSHGLYSLPFGYSSLHNFTDQESAISQHDCNHCGCVRPYDPSRL